MALYVYIARQDILSDVKTSIELYICMYWDTYITVISGIEDITVYFDVTDFQHL